MPFGSPSEIMSGKEKGYNERLMKLWTSYLSNSLISILDVQSHYRKSPEEGISPHFDNQINYLSIQLQYASHLAEKTW